MSILVDIEDLPSGRVEWEDVIGVIENSKKVVRCKNCETRSEMLYNHLGNMRYFCGKVEKYVSDCDFCAWGKERSE